MFIKKDNLSIRNATATDAPRLGNWWRDGKVMAHAGFPQGLSTTDEEIEKGLATDTDDTYRRLIIEVDTMPIGEMNYRNIGNGVAEVGIKICDFSMQEKGYGSQFIHMLIDVLFGQYRYQKIILDTNLNNNRAQHVYEKLGFRKVRERHDCWKDQLGELQSAVDYEMTKSEYISHVRKLWWGCVYDQFEHGSDDTLLLLDLIGSRPQNILEVCCGTGRVLVPLAEAGHIVTGIDADEGMLARLSAKTSGLTNLKYSLANALTTDWGNNYDVVVLADNTLMNIENREDDKAAQKHFIQKAADALRPGGHFFIAFDFYPEPEKIFNRDGGHGYSGVDDTGVSGQFFNYGGRYDPVTQIATWLLHLELTMQSGAKYIIPEFGWKYVCTREDVHGWLNEAGFVIEQEYGDCNRTPFIGKAGWDIVWARKI